MGLPAMHSFRSRDCTRYANSCFQSLLAIGMQYLHRSSIVHRDLKSLNILYNSAFTLKLCDFGLSRCVIAEMPFFSLFLRITNREETHKTNDLGTVAWIAPEIFQRKPYSMKSDVYSYGTSFSSLAPRASSRLLQHYSSPILSFSLLSPLSSPLLSILPFSSAFDCCKASSCGKSWRTRCRLQTSTHSKFPSLY